MLFNFASTGTFIAKRACSLKDQKDLTEKKSNLTVAATNASWFSYISERKVVVP